MNKQRLSLILVLLLLLRPAFGEKRGRRRVKSAEPAVAPAAALQIGQTSTLLPDGRWLTAGGQNQSGPLNQLAIRDTNASTPLALGLARARAWHTATLLPNGAVLILGGTDAAGVVDTPELFDPLTLQFQFLHANAPTPRAYHTATLLTDGRVLIAGGISTDGSLLQTAEIWDPQGSGVSALASKLSAGRRNHTATLLPDGKVLLWGGTGPDGSALQNGELYDPDSQTFTPVDTPPAQANVGAPRVEASFPADGARAVPWGTLIALRFSQVLNVTTLNGATIKLSDDSHQPVAIKVVPAEGGILAFLTPETALRPSTTYTVSVNGPKDASDRSLTPYAFAFTTADANPANTKRTPPNTDEPDNLPPLQAPLGVTALAGRILASLNAKPIAGVSLTVTCGAAKPLSARSDATGRFLISSTGSGHCKLEIDGTPNAQQKKDYGTYFVGVNIASGTTNALSYFIWLTELDHVHAVTIPSPTTSQLIISTPRLPGLQLVLAPGTTIADYDGNVVTQVSITPIPLGRTPFPLPNVPVSFYFTIQPGGAYIRVSGNGPQGAQLIYPNLLHAPTGRPFDFWNYDPDQKGWYVYGQGAVSADRKSIVPNPGVVLYEFTGAMETSPAGDPPSGPNPNCSLPGTQALAASQSQGKKAGCSGGEPVDLGTGLFVYTKTDLDLPGVMPIALTRTYRQGDNMSRAFGVGATHSYNIFLSGDTFPYTYMDLILGDGSRIHYPRTSTGTSYTDAIYVHTGTQTAFYQSQITWNGNGWNLKFKDGSLWVFPEAFQKSPTQGALISMADRFGNQLTLNRDATTGNLNSITSSSGRWINLSYDPAGRITQAQDNSGRTVTYSYDVEGRLAKVIDANGGVTKYAYDPNNQMITITDPRNITYLTTYYDISGKVIEQDAADGSVYRFAYTTDANGNIIQTDVTNPRGYVDRSGFDTSGYFSGGNLTLHTGALGQPEQQTTSTQYDPAGTGLTVSSTDALGRQTSYTYDACGNTASITRLAETPNAVTTTMAYQTGSGTYLCVASFNQITSITDPLNHTTTFGYDSSGKNLTSITDPLQHAVTIARNADGQPASVADFAGTTQFSYTNGDLIAVTDPTSNITHRTLDLAGRLVLLQAPLGQITQYQYDALNDLLKITDALNGQTSFTYDGNSNLLTVQDARTNTTMYTPDSMDRVASREDALQHTDTYQYDLNGNLSLFLDRKNQATSYTYDGLDRLAQVRYADQSIITYTYDAGNRRTQIADSLAGTITRTYDGLDRLLSETTPQGTVSYTYDAAGRRATMSVSGQSTISYTFDNANRLTQIAQGTATVTIAYDNANRRTSLTLPNGVVAAYGYDAASRVTSITYMQGSTTIGNLTYTYDANGRRVQMNGSFAQVNLPQGVSSAAYNADNQLTQWGSATLTYDLNGNLTSDGTNTYTWDARKRLAALGSTTFAYDGLGRRIRNAAGSAFLYDAVNAVQELSGSTVTANLLTGLGVDEIFTRADSAGARSFLTDALGSTLALTDSSGTVQTQYTYEPFGKTTASGSLSSNSFQYTGRENDGAGLYYYRARYYNPTLQRFISEDPIGFGDRDANLFAYVADNPLGYSDPMGLAPQAPRAPPPTWPVIPRYPTCPASPQNCSQYPPGGLLRWVCMNGGDGPWGSCVRKCLRESYLKCSTFGCVVDDHLVCWLKCVGNEGKSN